MNRKIGVILSYILMGVEVLSTLLLTPYIIKTLGDAEYGVYRLSASIATYLLLLDLGIGNSVTRFVSKYRVEGNQTKCETFLGITTVYYILVAVVCLIGGGVLIVLFPTAFAKGLSADEIFLGQKLLAITSVNAAVTLGVAGFKNTIAAYERFDVTRGFSIVSVIIRIALTLVALKLNLGSIGISGVNLLLSVLTAVLYIFFVVSKLQLKPIFRGNNRELAKEVIVYSSFILIQMVATQINACMDSVLLGMLVETSAVIIAVYGVGQQITQYFQSIGSAVTSVLMPGVVQMVEKGTTSDKLCEEMIRIGRMIFMVLGIIWSGFFVFGRQFILLWVGESKLEAFWVALVLMGVYTFVLTEAIGTQILWAKNEHREQSLIKLSIVMLNIILTAFLIRWNPLYGAMIGTALSIFLGDIVVMNYVFAKKIQINLLKYYESLFRGILPCLLIATIAGFLFSKVGLQNWFGLAVNLLVMISVYCMTMIRFGMSTYERDLVLSCVNRIRETIEMKGRL